MDAQEGRPHPFIFAGDMEDGESSAEGGVGEDHISDSVLRESLSRSSSVLSTLADESYSELQALAAADMDQEDNAEMVEGSQAPFEESQEHLPPEIPTKEVEESSQEGITMIVEKFDASNTLTQLLGLVKAKMKSMEEVTILALVFLQCFAFVGAIWF